MSNYITIIEDGEEFEKTIQGIKFNLKKIGADRYQELRKARTKVKNRGGVRTEIVDEAGLNSDLLDEMIIGWEKGGIRNRKGDILEPSKPVKQSLPSDFQTEIIEACDSYTVDNEEAEAREEEEKNSESSSFSS